MPTVRVDVDNTNLTVSRPVALRIAYDLVSALGLPYNTRVILPGSDGPEDLPVTTIDRGSDSIYGKELKIVMEMHEKFVDDRIYTDSLYQNENKPLFYEKEHGIIISPAYAHTELEMDLKFRFPSKQAAEKQLADMKRNVTLFSSGIVHEVEYTYFIPKVNLVILAELYRCKEKNVPSGIMIDQWVRAGLNGDITTSNNLTGTATELTKKEIQARIHGEFDFDILPEKSEQDDNQRVHILTFKYKIKFDKILSTVMTYPHILNNSHIAKEFFDATIPAELGHRLQAPPRMVHNLDHFTGNQEVTGFIDGVPIPHYHDWYPKFQLNNMVGLLRVLLTLSPTGLREVFNLEQLGLVELCPELIEYAKANHSTIGNRTDSILTVILYEDDRILNGEHISVDADLNITTTFDMDITKNYSVWVAVLADFNMLSNSAMSDLCFNGAFARFILNAIDPTLASRGLLPPLKHNGTIDKRTLKKSIIAITRKRNPNTGNSFYSNYRVGSFVVTVNN